MYFSSIFCAPSVFPASGEQFFISSPKSKLSPYFPCRISTRQIHKSNIFFLLYLFQSFLFTFILFYNYFYKSYLLLSHAEFLPAKYINLAFFIFLTFLFPFILFYNYFYQSYLLLSHAEFLPGKYINRTFFSSLLIPEFSLSF
jgi:hypothetical protein